MSLDWSLMLIRYSNKRRLSPPLCNWNWLNVGSNPRREAISSCISHKQKKHKQRSWDLSKGRNCRLEVKVPQKLCKNVCQNKHLLVTIHWWNFAALLTVPNKFRESAHDQHLPRINQLLLQDTNWQKWLKEIEQIKECFNYFGFIV